MTSRPDLQAFGLRQSPLLFIKVPKLRSSEKQSGGDLQDVVSAMACGHGMSGGEGFSLDEDIAALGGAKQDFSSFRVGLIGPHLCLKRSRSDFPTKDQKSQRIGKFELIDVAHKNRAGVCGGMSIGCRRVHVLPVKRNQETGVGKDHWRASITAAHLFIQFIQVLLAQDRLSGAVSLNCRTLAPIHFLLGWRGFSGLHRLRIHHDLLPLLQPGEYRGQADQQIMGSGGSNGQSVLHRVFSVKA